MRTPSETQPEPTAPPAVPNHHADFPGFAGVSGLLAALSMSFGRGSDARLVADIAGVTGADHVVDIGCGPGAAAREAARRGARTTGVDPSAVMLRVARVLAWRSRSVEWRRGGAEALPIDDGDATVAWSVACVHHWASITDGLAEVRRALAAGGRFVAIERRVQPGASGHGSNGNHGWVPEQAEAFARSCRAAGFVDVEISSRETKRGAMLVVRAVAA